MTLDTYGIEFCRPYRGLKISGGLDRWLSPPAGHLSPLSGLGDFLGLLFGRVKGRFMF